LHAEGLLEKFCRFFGIRNGQSDMTKPRGHRNLLSICHQHLLAPGRRQAPRDSFRLLLCMGKIASLSSSDFRLYSITASAGSGSVGGTASQKTFQKLPLLSYLSDLSELERRRMKQFRNGELAIHQALFVKVLR